MFFFMVAAVSWFCGWMCGRIAKPKGYDPTFWFLMGILFGLLAVVIILILPTKKEEKVMPHPPLATEVLDVKPRETSFRFSSWYYLNGQHEPQGPLNSRTLQAILKEGKISLTTYVWNEEMTEWKPLQDIWPQASSLI